MICSAYRCGGPSVNALIRIDRHKQQGLLVIEDMAHLI